MKILRATASLWSSLKNIFDPTEKNKHLVAIFGVLVAIIAIIATIAWPDNDPSEATKSTGSADPSGTGAIATAGPTRHDDSWIKSVDRECAVADAKIDTGHESVKDIAIMRRDDLPIGDPGQLIPLLKRISTGIKIPAEAARTFAYNVIKLTPPEMRDEIIGDIERLNSGSSRIYLLTQSVENLDPTDPASTTLVLEQMEGAISGLNDIQTAFQSIGLLGPETCKEIFHGTEIT